jgi:hypothetical protein
MAIHSALQIFRPATRGISDGLYDHRRYVFSGGVLIPGIMASLAFVNTGAGYESLGALCQLPIRPFWYRLALTWVPRYLIALIIFGLAGAIYAYAGCEFRSYSHLSQSMQTPMATTLGLSRIDGEIEAANELLHTEMAECRPNHPRRASSIAHDVVASQHRETAVVFGPTIYAPDRLVPVSVSCVQSLRESSTDPPKRSTSVRPSLSVIPSGYTIKPSPADLDLHAPLSPLTQPMENPLSRVIPETLVEKTPVRDVASSDLPTQRHLQRQRRRIHRQLRLMFVYPLVYILMWLIPFLLHCMNYNDYYANHPLWFLRIGQTICLASMGFVDCFVFSMREKPWRRISTSDGTIWGSLAMWRFSQRLNPGSMSENASGARNGSRSTVIERSMSESVHGGRVARVRNSVRTSASDDYTKLAAEQARKRLGLEKVERLAAMQTRNETRRLEEYGSREMSASGSGDKEKKENEEREEKTIAGSDTWVNIRLE